MITVVQRADLVRGLGVTIGRKGRQVARRTGVGRGGILDSFIVRRCIRIRLLLLALHSPCEFLLLSLFSLLLFQTLIERLSSTTGHGFSFAPASARGA